MMLLQGRIFDAEYWIADAPPPDALLLQQEHGVNIVYRDGDESGTPAADGQWTDRKDVPLAVRTADCLPILCVVPGRAVAAVHAGWRGIDAGILPRLWRTWSSAGLPLETAGVLIGPHICGSCFAMRVPELDRFLVPERRYAVRLSQPGAGFVDLVSVVLGQLADVGPIPATISVVGGCTFHSGGGKRWPSYRRDGGTMARLYTVIRRTEP